MNSDDLAQHNEVMPGFVLSDKAREVYSHPHRSHLIMPAKNALIGVLQSDRRCIAVKPFRTSHRSCTPTSIHRTDMTLGGHGSYGCSQNLNKPTESR